jgi:hypothetical protein
VHRLTAAQRSPAGLVLEPAHPEAAGEAPRDLTSRTLTSRPDNGSWDFDGNEQDFGEERNPPKPHETHETSPVLGASVVGMTSGVCQGQRCLPAGVPGVSMASSREDRLWLKGWLCQQPADDSTEESQSRAMKTRFLQRLYHRKWPGPDKIDRGKRRE